MQFKYHPSAKNDDTSYNTGSILWINQNCIYMEDHHLPLSGKSLDFEFTRLQVNMNIIISW